MNIIIDFCLLIFPTNIHMLHDELRRMEITSFSDFLCHF